MQKNNNHLNAKNSIYNWVTIREAVGIVNKKMNINLTYGDIYRHALHGNIHLSIYFQSSVILRKVRKTKNKIKIKPTKNSFIDKLCFLDSNHFISDNTLMVSTEGKYIHPKNNIIDTNLMGGEYIAIQHLLAKSLGIPSPIKGDGNTINGISVNLSGETFLLYEKTTWKERIHQQIIKLPKDIASKLHAYISSLDTTEYSKKEYFPVYKLPPDACFVIRDAEIDKLVNQLANDNTFPSTTRISTPLSRLFWLACKHNETISPLIRQPYKLLSIFEQWASEEGITDRFSGDTLKAALERGSPTAVAASKR